MAVSRPLAIAIAAGALLVVVLVADAQMDRSVHVDARDEQGGWVTLASAGEVPQDDRYRAMAPAPIRVESANSTVTLRVRVENGYPWGYDKAFVAYADGVEVARGRLASGARDSGTTEFTVPVSRVVGSQYGKTMEPTPTGGNGPTYFANVQVTLGRQQLYAGFSLEVEQ